MQNAHPSMPDTETLRAANVNPATGLATDYLNVFNEYIMLAELVADGSIEAAALNEWQPIDYESHFVQSGFTGADAVLAAYRALDAAARDRFEEAVNGLIDLVLTHQNHTRISPASLDDVEAQRDVVAALISGPHPGTDIANEHMQATIDALFD